MRTDYISPKVMYAIIDDLKPQNALAMELSLYTGLRIGDVVSLPFSALESTCINYIASKTKKSGTAKITHELFRRLLRNTDGIYLFPSKKSKTGHIARQTVWKDVKKNVKKKNIVENVAPHSARKVFAVEHLKTEGISAVQKELQHSDLGTTLLYCLSDKRLFGMNEEIIARLWGIEEKINNIERMFYIVDEKLNKILNFY